MAKKRDLEPAHHDVAAAASDYTEPDGAGLEAMLDYLLRSRGFDFTGYKRATLSRRIRRRMQVLEIAGYAEYIDYLEVRPDEFPQLFNTILINVTGFFRDSAAWVTLRELMEKRIAARERHAPIRIWSAGCASGEEPYSLAIMMVELLGIEQYSERVKIYATDVDEEALAQARLATYSPKGVDDVPAPLLAKYFSRAGASFCVNKDVRRGVIYGRHDLVQDAPISRIDLLVCRNTLMYFNAETQTRILNRLQFALRDEGLLFLGKAEMLLTHANLFTPVDIKLRVFARARHKTRERLAIEVKADDANGQDSIATRSRLQKTAFDRSPAAQIVVDTEGHVALINHRAAHLFSLTPSDLRRPFHDLEVSYRPADLRSAIDRVKKERRAVYIREVERPLASGQSMFLDVEVAPLIGDVGATIGVQLSFTDVTDAHRLHTELQKTHGELEAAHEELQSTSEELETTNEELQSTVEELETTNEELQSTNEELETMNEELQSTNEELQAMNGELRSRGEELHDLSAFFSSILGSTRSGVAVLDQELLVRAWNPKMEELWGLRADEVQGKPFVSLDIGMPIDQLASAIRASLTNGEGAERTVECTNRRGRKIRCRVVVTPLASENSKGVTMLVEEEAAE